MEKPLEPTVTRVLIVVFGIVVIGALVGAASSSTGDFSGYNTGWDGASEFRAGTPSNPTEVVQTTDVYEQVEPSETVAVVFSPDTPYTGPEIDRIRQFVSDGGTLVVAEDFGPHTNELLAGVGARARIDGRVLRDEWNNFRSPSLVVAPRLSDHSLVRGIDQLTLNYGTAVRANNATVLVRSSDLSYLDTDRNGDIGDNETLTSYPVVTLEEIDSGRVIVVSDPSIFINRMLERPGNREFATRILEERETVVIDYTHETSVPDLALVVSRFREDASLQLLVGLTSVLGIGIFLSGRDVRDSRRAGERPQPPRYDDEMVAYLKSRHPDWDERRIARLVAKLNENRENR